MDNQTFYQLARTWKYAGLPGDVEFTFIDKKILGMKDHTFRVAFLYQVRKALLTSIEEAEGYFAVMLEKAVVPGVVTYTLSGGRSEHGNISNSVSLDTR